jgi:hypothetical protein
MKTAKDFPIDQRVMMIEYSGHSTVVKGKVVCNDIKLNPQSVVVLWDDAMSSTVHVKNLVKLRKKGQKKDTEPRILKTSEVSQHLGDASHDLKKEYNFVNEIFLPADEDGAAIFFIPLYFWMDGTVRLEKDPNWNSKKYGQ